MRAKIRAIREGRIPTDLEFAEILKLPDEFDDNSRTQTQTPTNTILEDLQLGSQPKATAAQGGRGTYPIIGHDSQHVISSIRDDDDDSSLEDEADRISRGEEGEHIGDARVAEMMIELERMGQEDAPFDDEEDFDFDEEDEEDEEDDNSDSNNGPL